MNFVGEAMGCASGKDERGWLGEGIMAPCGGRAAIAGCLRGDPGPGRGAGGVTLAEIIDREGLQELMDECHGVTGVAATIVDGGGEVLVSCGWQDICAYFHRVHPGTRCHCLESDTALVAPGERRVVPCGNGMFDVVFPIRIGGEHLGNFVFGQFFYEDEEPDRERFRRQARCHGFDEEAYLSAFDRVPRWTRDKIDRIMGFFSTLVARMALQGQSRLILARALLVSEKALAAMRHSEEKFRTLFETLPSAVIYSSATGEILCINPAAAALHGLSVEECRGRSLKELQHGLITENGRVLEDDEHPAMIALRTRESVGPMLRGLPSPETGRPIWLSISSVPLFARGEKLPGQVYTLYDDISGRKRSEERLRQSEERLSEALRIAKLGHWELDRSVNVFTFSDEIYTMLRVAAVAAGGYEMTVADYARRFLHPDDRGRVLLELERARCSDDEEHYAYLEHRVIFGDGAGGYLAMHIRSRRGRPLCIFGVNQDITTRRQAEEALRESEMRLTMALRVARMGYWRYDCQSGRMEWSPGHETLFGVDRERCGESLEAVRLLVHPEDQDHGLHTLCRALEEKAPFSSVYRVVPPGGEVRWHYSYGMVFRDSLGLPSHFFGVTQDITAHKKAKEEREKLHSQLIQAQKMESVGRLAGGVAHDFNNMLGVILGYTGMSLERLTPGDPLHTALTEIETAARRSADLTKQLLAFARKQVVSPRMLNLNSTIEAMLRLLRRLIGEDIGLLWMPGKNLWPVRMDPVQIDQILANLCVNARDAISGVGKVTIATGNVSLDDRQCARHEGFFPGDYVRLAVSDNGCGMDDDTLPHIFEPFFTTKEVGKGTGLGLATVYGVIKQNNGFIYVNSRPGQGSVFEIYLPRHSEGEDSGLGMAPAQTTLRGSETILVVEDEPSILTMATLMLQRMGYKVLAAPTPGEAISLARAHGAAIDLVLTDVIMPEMNGRDLVGNLTSLCPGLRCLYMSGYTAEIIASHGVLDPGVNFIKKPFMRDELGAKIREILQSGGAERDSGDTPEVVVTAESFDGSRQSLCTSVS